MINATWKEEDRRERRMSGTGGGLEKGRRWYGEWKEATGGRNVGDRKWKRVRRIGHGRGERETATERGIGEGSEKMKD